LFGAVGSRDVIGSRVGSYGIGGRKKRRLVEMAGHFEKGAWIEDRGRLSPRGTAVEDFPAGTLVYFDSEGKIRKVRLKEV